jgi:CBS domain-containing protein
MTVERICVREVDLAEADETVQVAAHRMKDRQVGTLLIQDAESRPIGIITDRDLAVRVVGEALDPTQTTVAEVMTKSPESVREETPIESALSRMRSGPYRRLPVVDANGKLVGLVSLDDILDLLAEEFNEIGQLLKSESPSNLAGA